MSGGSWVQSPVWPFLVLTEMIPQELMSYRSVFDKVAANRFPDRQPWDHAIDLQPDFIPKKAHIYPLSLPE